MADTEKHDLRWRWRQLTLIGTILAVGAGAAWWFSGTFATAAQVHEVKKATATKIEANTFRIQAMRTDVSTVKADVSNLKESARWQMDAIYEIAKERGLRPSPPPKEK
jgi:hypothetical protein